MVSRGYAPRSPAYQAGALLLSYKTRRSFRSDAKTFYRTKYITRPFCWPDAQDALWLITAAKEQLALVADDGFHGVSFLKFQVK